MAQHKTGISNAKALDILEWCGGVGYCHNLHPLHHDLNIVNWILRKKPQGNFKLTSNIFIQGNAFEKVVRKMATILPRPQFVNIVISSSSCFKMAELGEVVLLEVVVVLVAAALVVVVVRELVMVVQELVTAVQDLVVVAVQELVVVAVQALVVVAVQDLVVVAVQDLVVVARLVEAVLELMGLVAVLLSIVHKLSLKKTAFQLKKRPNWQRCVEWIGLLPDM